MTLPKTPVILTANDLRSGEVVYWSAQLGWQATIDLAEIFRDISVAQAQVSEIDDPLQRDIVLRKWIDLPQHLYVKDAQGNKYRATFDERQVGETRLSSVQYLKFKCGMVDPVSVGIDKPGLELETELNNEQATALKADLEAA